ncbi:ribosomal protein L32 [Moorella thermoacetica Y72]|nr:ribosomal protein L32 [Moorella thermoacetica Y72]
MAAPTLVECPQCHQLKLNHRVCPKCGYYKGREAIQVAE